jgi:hypothetical protein
MPENFHSKNGWDETKRKAQERMERRSRKIFKCWELEDGVDDR